MYRHPHRPRPRNPRKLLFASLALTLGLLTTHAHASLEMHINPTTGEVSLVSVGATDFDLYQIAAPNASDWNFTNAFHNSLFDQGFGWFELSGSNLLAEGDFSLVSNIVLSNGQTLSLGTPYVGSSSAVAGDFTFEYHNTTDPVSPLTLGTVIIESSSTVPTPAALPAGLALIALTTTRRRRRK